jgi:hypothetical protein
MIVMDIDGTVADDRHRLNLRGAIDWDAYHSLAEEDLPNHGPINLINKMTEIGCVVVLISSRPESTRNLTNKWLLINKVMAGHLLMRANDDWRPAPIIKVEMLNEFTKRAGGLLPVDMAFDSRDDVCEAYRSIGLATAQVTAWPIAR